MNPAQPPEGILDPQQPYWPANRVGEVTWLRLKGKLTGRPVPGLSENFTSYVKLGDADADRLIANIKKYGQYPQVNQNDKYGGAYNNEAYQKWLVEEFLEKPFREEVNEKIDAKTERVLNRVFPEAQEEIKEAETKSEVAAVIEDKVEVLEAIKEDMNPPRSEYQIPDPWEGSYTSGSSAAPQATVKKTKKRGRPKGSTNKTKKKKKKAASGGGGSQPPSPPPKKSFASKFGGGLKGVAKSIGNKTLKFMEGGASVGENEGPSVLGAGAWIGNKIKKAFQDAKAEKARALEAEANGAELPPEVKEKGYFLKKSLGYQFGGKVLDQTVGTFFENIPSKQSSKKAGFGDKFDYGDADPKKKKQQQSEIKDLASGFRSVTKSLGAINKRMGDLIQTMSKLVGETSRVADTLEGIQNAIAKSIDVEIESGSTESEAQQATTGDINIPDIDFSGLMGKDGGGLDWFDMLFAADDARDIAKRIKGGGERTTTRRGGPRITGDVPKRNRFRFPSLPGRRFKFAEGTAGVASPVRAMIGEAGPEVVTGSPKKFAAGAIFGGSGTNIVASQSGGGEKELLKKVQPFANVFDAAFQVIGSHISGALSNLVSAAGPFSGVIAKMFSPLLGGLATVFGLNQGAFAAEINSAAMTEKQGAKVLSKFFANFFKLFGIDIGEDEEDDGGDDDDSPYSGEWGPLLDLIKSVEAGTHKYNAINYGSGPGFIEGLTEMTIREADAAAEEYHKKYPDSSGALGQYQFMTPIEQAKAAGLNPDTDKFSPANQDKMAVHIIENKRRGNDWKERKISDDEFMEGLAAEWRGLPANSGGQTYQDSAASRNAAGTSWEKFKKAIEKIKGGAGMARGGVKPASFLNSIGEAKVFEISGSPDGYKVPEYLTGGQPVIGHGLEWLIKMPNKFIILPGVNKEYNVYRDPAKAFNRYGQIAQQGGVDGAGLTSVMGEIIFGGGEEISSTLNYGDEYNPPPNIRGSAADKLGAEILGNRIKSASLPEGTVTPVAIPKDTVTGTIGVAAVAMVQQVYVPVPVPGPERVEYVSVPASSFVAARKNDEMRYLQSVS